MPKQHGKNTTKIIDFIAWEIAQMNTDSDSIKVSFIREHDRIVLQIPNRMDTLTTARCEKSLLEHIKTNALEVVFDMRKTSFVSSAFLRVCIMYLREMGTPRFKLANMSPDVKKVFKMTGLDV